MKFKTIHLVVWYEFTIFQISKKHPETTGLLLSQNINELNQSFYETYNQRTLISPFIYRLLHCEADI